MSSCPVVVQVFFDHDPRRTKNDAFDSLPLWVDSRERRVTHWRSWPLWLPDGRPSYRWAVDYVVCGDERWMIFGPFRSVSAARGMVRLRLHRLPFMLGYRIINEHCVKYTPGAGIQRKVWTDG